MLRPCHMLAGGSPRHPGKRAEARARAGASSPPPATGWGRHMPEALGLRRPRTRYLADESGIPESARASFRLGCLNPALWDPRVRLPTISSIAYPMHPSLPHAPTRRIPDGSLLTDRWFGCRVGGRGRVRVVGLPRGARSTRSGRPRFAPSERVRLETELGPAGRAGERCLERSPHGGQEVGCRGIRAPQGRIGKRGVTSVGSRGLHRRVARTLGGLRSLRGVSGARTEAAYWCAPDRLVARGRLKVAASCGGSVDLHGVARSGHW